ncbi:MAG: hypothetical protein ACI9VR_005136, partial [Cognaticolwellia sp.]
RPILAVTLYRAWGIRVKTQADPSESPPELDAIQSRFVASTWAFRASAERAAALRFERLACTLRAVQAPQTVVDLAQRAVVDERRHIGLCDGLATHFGWTGSPLPPGPHAPIGPSQASAGERLLYEMVSSCCLSETLNACMLRAILDRASSPMIRDTVRSILGDEVHHARLGWLYLEHARGGDVGEFLGPLLPRMLQGIGAEYIDAPDPPGRDAPRLAAWGELDQESRSAIFHAAMRDVVLPGLERVKVPTGAARAWLAAHTGASHDKAPGASG